ncbi:hypothetical protein E2C01_001926 [Portunus trituberculatus]|uniref:Uncharacterized protein n=1 Tax=Portunus trituberculatus TaxID=210409 RepID=A0A5B7CJH6_PORTR|nr:hypothetical protein [Portunus trituberculatus]
MCVAVMRKRIVSEPRPTPVATHPQKSGCLLARFSLPVSYVCLERECVISGVETHPSGVKRECVCFRETLLPRYVVNFSDTTRTADTSCTMRHF